MSNTEIADSLREIKSLLQSQAPKPLSLPEAAEYLGVSRSYVYSLTSGGLLPHFKSQGGKKLSFLRRDLDAWLLAHRVKPREEIRAELATCQ